MMSRKSVYQCRSLVGVCLSIVCWGFIHSPLMLQAAWSETQIATQKEAVRQAVQEAFQQADALFAEGKYDEAFRLLFDAMYAEERVRLQLAVERNREGDEEFPITAAYQITTLERRLIHEDSSPLMQLFRDPNIPLQEKLTCLVELRRLAETQGQEGADSVFRETYRGPFIQLMTSPRLNIGEKTDILSEIRDVIQTEYVAATQHDQISDEILRLRLDAEQKFQAQQYIEAFLLMDKASQKARDIELSGVEYISLLKQRAHMETEFVNTDQSSLMQVFKNQDISTQEKQTLLYDLSAMVGDRSLPANTTVILQDKEYSGMLVDILTHPDIHWMTKYSILVTIDAGILKREPDYDIFLHL